MSQNTIFFEAFFDEFEKVAKIFGTREPEEVYEEHAGITPGARARAFQGYARTKGGEEPTSRARAGWGGAGVGGGLGAALGASLGSSMARNKPGRGALIGGGIGALLGGGLGALTGLGMRKRDIGEIEHMKRIAENHPELRAEMARRMASFKRSQREESQFRENERERAADRRNQELADAFREGRR